MIAIGCDHGGFELKQQVIEHLKEQGIEVKDMGCNSTASCDYPEYAKAVAEDVAAGNSEPWNPDLWYRHRYVNYSK